MKEEKNKENLPVSLRFVQVKNLSEEDRVAEIVGFVKAYNGLSVNRAHHSPISKIVDLTRFYNDQESF